MKRLVSIYTILALAATACATARRAPLSSSGSGFPVAGVFYVVNADGKTEFSATPSAVFTGGMRLRVLDRRDSVLSVSRKYSGKRVSGIRLKEAGRGRPFRAGDKIIVTLGDGRSKVWTYTPYLR